MGFQCTTVLSGDPKIEDLIYHLDSRTFEYQGEPDLSVVHVRCSIPSLDAVKYYQSDGQTISDYDNYDTVYAAVDPTPTFNLNETDFEQPVAIFFQLSEWPGKDGGEFTEQIVKDELNQDFLWSDLPDKLLSEEERNYEDYYSTSPQAEYDHLREIAKGTKPWVPYVGPPWTGEVGIMVFARSRKAPREFMWTLHNDKDIARKVSQENLCG
jgi:hypothetical protein